MKIKIEVEPVLCKCKHSAGHYYAFRVIGLSDGQFVPSDVIVATSVFTYPGNDAVREFINAASAAVSPHPIKAPPLDVDFDLETQKKEFREALLRFKT